MAIIKPTLNLVASEYTPETLNVTRASSATRVNAAGLVELVGAGTLRYDYDPTTLAGKGWLIEESRSNTCLQSEDFNTTWTKSTAAVDTNQTTAPDGNSTADYLKSASGSAVTQLLLQTIAVTGSQTHSFGVFAKADTVTYLALYFDTGSTNKAYVNVNLSDGTVEASGVTGSGFTLVSTTITEYLDGWYHINMVATGDSGTSARMLIVLLDAANKASAPTPTPTITSGEGCYIWGAQCEENVSVGTSYIPTTTAAVTRAADTMTVNLSDIDFNDGGEGTAYLHAEFPDVSEMGNGSPFALDDGTTADKILMYGQSATNQVHVGGAEQFGGTAGTLPDATPYRYALTWATNNFNYARDGSLFQSADTSGNVPTSLTTIRFGNTPGHVHIKKQHVVHFALFPARLIDADLQTITTG
jgi:hypothetical protein